MGITSVSIADVIAPLEVIPVFTKDDVKKEIYQEMNVDINWGLSE